MSRYTKLISFAIPCYNEEQNVFPCYEALRHIAKRLPKYRFEYVFADNGSTDRTAKRIQSLAKKDKRVKAVCLSRNFGPEASQQATIDYSTGDAVIPYDADMEDPANVIPLFVRKWEEGFDIILGIRTTIDNNGAMTLLRRIYYRLFHAIADIDIPVDAGAFSLLDRKVVDAIRALPETYRFFRGLRAWVGFRTATIPYQRQKRFSGKSSSNIFLYLSLAQRSFFGFSYLFLSIIVYLGFFLTLLSFVFLTVYLLAQVGSKSTIDSFTIIISVIVMLGGMQLLALSVIGKYIQVIVEETKKRPLYVVGSTINVR